MGQILADHGHHHAGPAHPWPRRTGAGFKHPDQRGLAGQRPWRPNQYQVALAIRSSRHRRSTVVFFLRPSRSYAETLAWAGKGGGPPGGLPQPWGGDEGTRRDRATLERGGSGGFSSGMRICMLAMSLTASVLNGIGVRASRGRKKGWVR
jgi:hypothetical protein